MSFAQLSMSWRFRMLHTLVIVALFFPQKATQEVTLGSDRELVNERNCVQDCMDGVLGDTLWNAVGCANSDACLCKDNVRPYVSSYLASCIETYYKTCSDGQDYAIGVSIYDRYCDSKGPATVLVNPTAEPVPGPEGPGTVTLFTSKPTATVYLSSAPGTKLPKPSAYLLTLGLTFASSIVVHRAWV